ncbi:MAG: hypothetical protein WC251_00620 [Candidatus Izemoplasmatales bacterium]
MISNEFGYDFRLIRTARLMQKSRVLAFLGLVFFLCFFPIVAVFLVLYLLEVPIEIDGVMTNPGDTAYLQFFRIFLLAMGIPSLISLLIIFLGLFTKSKPYAYLGLNQDYEPVVYAVNNKNHVYIDKELLITLDLRTGRLTKSRDQNDIQNAMLDYCFFRSFEAIQNPKIKHGHNYVKITFTVTTGRVKERRQYKIRFAESGEPKTISELIYMSAYGNNNLRSFKSIQIESVNQNLSIPYDPRIQREILIP